jgi:type I restriction enzyme, S subunit
MKLETFFEKFDQFADAPDAVTKMRELVLQLAVQGRLVHQDINDEPAEEMLQRITSTAKSRRRGIDEFDDIEEPFKIPGNWAWVRLTRVLNKLTDGTHHSPPNKPLGDFMYVTAKNIKTDGVEFQDITYVSKEIHDEIFSRCDPSFGDVLYIKDGATTGVATINQLKEPFSMLSSVALLKPSPVISNRYLLWAIRSPFFYEETRGAMKGAAITRVTLSVMAASLLPLPPLAEQKRIVAKVEELMALCDRLEAQQKEGETRHIKLARAAIARFDEAPTPANLDWLFHPSYSVTPADLRETILNLAVQGKLISQDPNDQSVDELLATSDKQRQETAKSDRRASTDVTSLLSADDRWDIPDSWSWRALADLVLFIDYRGKTPNKVPSGIRLITAKNVRKGELHLSPEEFLSETDYRAWMTRGLPERGDVLFTTEAPMGNVAVVELAERFGLAQRIICFRSYGSLDPSFLVLQILSDSFQFILDKNATGMTAKGIKAGKLKLLPVAVPPLAEQRRIVAKVDLLMRIVDQLENQLRASRAFYKELLDAVVHELLHPAAEVVEFPLSESDRASQRAAIGCYAIEHLKRNPSFGHTMNMKVVYMAQGHIGLPLDLKFERQAAGPWHPWIEEFDAMGQSEGWFTVTQKSIGDGRTKYEYVPKAALNQKVSEAAAVLGEHKAEFDRLLGLFADLNTEKAEIVATLFAAWNDFLIDGKTPTDDEIIREVRENWHHSKGRFTPALLQRWLDWMRRQRLTPQGYGPRTRQQLTFRLK